jgi:UDP-glucose 4-epimerase
MHVLITGGAGFIGSHLAERHLAQGDKVQIVDDLSTGSRANSQPFQQHPNFRFIEADISHWHGLGQAVAWADRIYHLAAVVGVFRVLAEPIKVMTTNIEGCERLLSAVQQGSWKPQVLIASSSEVYGPRVDNQLAEDMDLIIQPDAPPRWNYTISKLADEALALSYAHVHDIPITVARLFNTVGPRQTGRYGMVIPRFVQQAVNDEPVTVFGDGQQSRSFIDVRDAAVMLEQLAAMACPEGLIVNVGNDREISILDLARLVIERAESDSTIEVIPYEVAYGRHYVDIPHRRPDLSRLHSLVTHRPEWTLEATLDDLIREVRQATLVKT